MEVRVRAGGGNLRRPQPGTQQDLKNVLACPQCKQDSCISCLKMGTNKSVRTFTVRIKIVISIDLRTDRSSTPGSLSSICHTWSRLRVPFVS